jgi:hypothetical protein
MAPPAKEEEDSDEEDEDYVYAPPSDDEGEGEVGKLSAGETLLEGINETNRSAIDDMFAEMNGGKEAVAARAAKEKKKGKKVAKKEKRAKSVLSDIFGSKAVAKTILSKKAMAGTAVDADRKLVKVTKKVVTEVKRFAGKDVMVEKVVLVDNNSKAAGGGLDGLLDNLKGVEKITTIAKTSSDWDGFKEKTGMGEDLEKAAQKGYLVKKDFLDRCDNRQFEVEKAGREKDRDSRR